MPRIGLDGRNIGRPGGTGVATYAAVLAQACRISGWQPARLLEAPPDRPIPCPHAPAAKARRLLSALSPMRRGLPTGDGDWVSPDLYRIAHVHFDLARAPLAIQVPDPPALMHWTYPLPLRMPGVPNLVTVHDLIPLLQPALTGIARPRMQRLLRAVLSRADRVVTVSETVRDDIVRTLGIAPERVENLYQAVDLPAALLADADRAERIAPSGCFVCIGSIEPRKNVARLIAAHGLSGTTRPLLLVGPDGEGVSAEMAALAGHPNPERVLRRSWTERPALLGALRQARALLFPSLAEGFGLPIAEAMTLGVPVLTAEGGATGEIAGSAALLVAPTETAALADAILRLDWDDALCAGLAEAGRVRAGLFSSEAYAARLDRLYRRVLDRSPAIT